MQKKKSEFKVERDENGRAVVSATELRKHFGAYLDFVEKEDLYIMRYGKVVVKMQSYERYMAENGGQED